jgi:diguanylate cyclase (GGDEF)-like protein
MNETEAKNLDIEGKTLDELEEEGYRIIDVVAGDAPTTSEIQYIIDKIVKEKRGTFYSDILQSLTSERFPEPDAKRFWQEILAHKYGISEKLGRNVGIRVASLDYLENVKKLIQVPKIIGEDEFRETIKLAATDSLTGVLNRRAFMKRFNDEMGFARRENYRFSMFMIDLDNFKEFNDSRGHAAGDLILQEFTVILRNELRKNDIIGRYGGDEFTVILPGTPKEDARKIAEKVRGNIEREMRTVNITTSIGIAEFPTDSDYLDGLISTADEAMYRAKEYGRNRVMSFKEVVFRYKPAGNTVKEVCCLGDFNKWKRRQGIMTYKKETGEWVISFNLKPGRYRYKFLVDGTKWTNDPAMTETENDGYGGACSVLNVKAD